MAGKQKKIQFIYFIYWILLAYIIAALIFWFIALTRQNAQMAVFKTERISATSPGYTAAITKIESDKKLKVAQYIGEGSTFLVLILAGAIFVFRAVRRQLKQSQQQQHFMMAITHELKTPIAVTKLNLQTLQKRKLEVAQQERLVSNTLQEANRLDALCNNLLVSSQIESGSYKLHMQQVDCAQLCYEAIKNIELRFANMHIETDLQNGCTVLGDASLLEIVLNNLLENARKYAMKNRPVTVSCSTMRQQCTIQIADEGPGIADEEKKRVFEKFYRTGNEATRSAKGTGLGLYICKKIINQHKGTITLTTNAQGGSTFTISLKLKNAAV